ncbi:MAG: methionine--tRNA ligase [Candidatus Saccharibacteria bacterium]|nr:methionine--tRNA ligase [Candidatus Saccharibacteria bacterium]
MTKQYAYITTAIPYVNGLPHIGHALDYMLADVWARYMRQQGKEVRFQAGVDEHGNKIAAKAADNNLTPQAYVDQTHVNFKQLIADLNISATDFIRTTDMHHKAAVQYIWQKLAAAGYIYKGSYEGWYCQGCENFVTDKEAAENNGICQDHQAPYQRLSEENYYFKASAFSRQIRQAIESNKLKIVPEFRKKEFLELIKDGLQDVSVSRPRKNLSWGVPVPGDDTQVMYVWLDALSNYLTVIGYPDRQEEWQSYWPANIQVIGKDILRFHAGIWPAMLLALDVPLPKVLLVHGFVNVGGMKMSKSLGNGVGPADIVPHYGADAFRYYFLRHVPTQDDGDFTWEKFEAAYNGELGNDLGNLVQRVAKMVQSYQAGVIGDAPQAEHDMGPYRQDMEALEFDKALDEIWTIVRSLNQYIERVKPWQVAKNRATDPEAEAHLGEILAKSCGTLLQVADMLAPFLPGTAAEIQRLFASGVIPADIQPLFPRLYLHTPDPRAPQPTPGA